MKILLVGSTVIIAIAASVGAGNAATLDDVMARLDSLQRDNQAMRKEIATLRKSNAAVTRQEVSATPVASRITPNVSSAMAADLPASQPYHKAPVPYANASYNWSGVYAGLNAGYAFGNENTSLVAPPPAGLFGSGRSDINGFAGGAQIGYNFQVNNVVFGAEADIQFSDIGSSYHALLQGPPPVLINNKVETFGTARGRVGYAFDRVLVYGTGGFAAGKTDLNLFGNGTATDSALHTGWAAGAGIEYGIRDGWSVKAEYLHVDLGSKDYLNGVTGTIITRSAIDFDLVRAGVNYRF